LVGSRRVVSSVREDVDDPPGFGDSAVDVSRINL